MLLRHWKCASWSVSGHARNAVIRPVRWRRLASNLVASIVDRGPADDRPLAAGALCEHHRGSGEG